MYGKVHRRIRARRGMSGITSQPPGLPVAISALSGYEALGSGKPALRSMGAPLIENVPNPIPTTSMVRAARLPPGIRAGRALGGPPNWYSAMQGTSLGADDQGSLQTPTLVEPGPTMAAWQDALIKQSQATDQTIQNYMATETKQRWIQIAATLSIPLAAAVWRLIFGRGVRDL